MVPLHESHGGAGLVVTVGGQFVVVAVSFAAEARADAAGEIKFFRGDVIPDFVDGAKVALIPGERGDIRHAGVQVICPHGVADGGILIDDRLVHLVVFPAAARVQARHLGTAVIEKGFRELQPALHPR